MPMMPSFKMPFGFRKDVIMNTKYRIKNNKNSLKHTDISHIGNIKREGDEWNTFTKCFTVSSLPSFAAIRFDSMGVCAAYINGEYIASNTGRYSNRITYAECTSKIKLGDNEIKLVLGGHYYQTINEQAYARRKARFSSVAAELEIECGSERETICTSKDWKCRNYLHFQGLEMRERPWRMHTAKLYNGNSRLIRPFLALCGALEGGEEALYSIRHHRAYPGLWRIRLCPQANLRLSLRNSLH